MPSNAQRPRLCGASAAPHHGVAITMGAKPNVISGACQSNSKISARNFKEYCRETSFIMWNSRSRRKPVGDGDCLATRGVVRLGVVGVDGDLVKGTAPKDATPFAQACVETVCSAPFVAEAGARQVKTRSVLKMKTWYNYESPHPREYPMRKIAPMTPKHQEFQLFVWLPLSWKVAWFV